MAETKYGKVLPDVRQEEIQGTNLKTIEDITTLITTLDAVIDLIKAKTDNLDQALSTMESDLRGASSKDLTTVEADIEGVKDNTGNRGSLGTGTITVGAAGTAVQGETVTVPEGCQVVLKARRTNTGYIYPGGSQANAQEQEFEMPPQCIVKLKVQNINDIWVDASVNGMVAEYLVEAA